MGAEDVLFALEDDAVLTEVVRAARQLQGPGPGRVRHCLRHCRHRCREQRREVQFARALHLASGAVQPLRGIGDEALHLIWRQVRVLLQDQRNGARRDRCCLGSPGATEEAAVKDALRMRLVDEAVGNAQALDVGTWSHEVRSLRLAGGRTGREAGDAVVCACRGPVRVRRADAENEGVVGGAGEAGREDATLEARVAGRRNHDDAALPRLLDGEGERVKVIRLAGVGAVGKVDHADVEPVVQPVLDHPVDRGDDLADVRAAIGGRDFEAQDARVGRDAAIRARRGAPVRGGQGRVMSGDQAGHERAMPKGVEIAQVRRL